MNTHEIADYAGRFIAGMLCFWVGYRQGKRAGILRGGKLALEAIAEWKRKYHYR